MLLVQIKKTSPTYKTMIYLFIFVYTIDKMSNYMPLVCMLKYASCFPASKEIFLFFSLLKI